MTQPPLSSLIFSPAANHNFSQILHDLKKSNLSITNRLTSIKTDAAFVVQVRDLHGLPLVANERCGSWYIPPHLKSASAYFKSTDGHMGQWSFSTRRLNLHLLELIGLKGGCIIVDSTRRGKRMPDALSKTVPIWCCVMNRVIYPEREEWHALKVPPSAVSESEKSQIEARLREFVENFQRLGVDVAGLREKLCHGEKGEKPLRPLWRTQDDPFPEEGEKLVFEEFYPVVCCTSSRRVAGAEMSEGGYIQGAGDDTENWAHGLTAPIFWEHADELLQTAEGQLPELIEKESWAKSKTVLEVGLGKNKVAGRNLRHALPTICGFVQDFLQANAQTLEKVKIIVACETGKDLSVGTVLALDCWCFDDGGELREIGASPTFTKTDIRVRLGRIMTAMPEANPTRTTLQSVNSYLMDWRK
ncbi:hypothetical protein DL546_002715 [Coniochaeta pulveracea]|uniref:Initiator tRNA phosphoribosyl transferase n=1 Tax=Coniochaeta pulveracea TaxID=177199 RepID=A0A420Y6L7_9PEZI|nr:hypothetical protein DL546_002715 [Coniochaeta pulveracea]